MQLKQNVNIHNRFDVYVDNIETGEHKEYTGYNIILNQMWDRLCAGNTYFVNINFGTGTGTPLANRTSLFTHLGTKAAVDDEVVKAFPVSRLKRKVVLNPEEYVGQSISEVGIAYGSSSTNLVTHAMLKDSEGNPISITKTNTDVVTIFATVFVTFDMSNPDLIHERPVSNSLVSYLIDRTAAPAGSFGLNDMVSAYARLGSTANVTWVADVPNKKRKTNVPRFGVSDANGHVQGVDFTNLFRLRLPATGIFSGEPYTNVNLGTGDGSNKLFNLLSRNIKSGSLVVKKNGVVVSNYGIENKSVFLDALIQGVPSRIEDIASNAAGTVVAIASFDIAPYLKVWDWTGSVWTERPQPPNIPTSGSSISLNSDGTVLAFGSSIAPYLKVWDWNGLAWSERPQAPNIPTSGGKVVLLSSDGMIVAFAVYLSPYLKIWDWTGLEWTERPQPPNATSLSSISLNSDGTVLALSSSSSPYLKVWDWTGSVWTERPQPPNIPTSGSSVSLNSDGTVLAFGSSIAPYLKVWDWNGTSWTERTKPSNVPNAGNSVSLNSDGSVAALGSSTTSPYLKVWNWDGSAWTEKPQMPNNGRADKVLLNADGTVLVTSSSLAGPYLKVRTSRESYTTDILFDTAPAIADMITADYIVNGIHKTNQRVVDVSFAIQFGEGV